MKKILAFLGSPRKNGATAAVMEQVIAGAKAEGAEVITYDLNDENIKGCQGCFYCRGNEGCATKDALAPMYEQMKEADGVIVASPIYFMNVTSQTKKLIDRLYPMINPDFSPRFPGKKAVTVYTQGNVDPNGFQGAIEGIDMILKMFGWELLDSIVLPGSFAPEESVKQAVMQRAFEAGKQLTK